MILEILKFIFSSPFVWIGFMYMGVSFGIFVFKCWNRFLRHLNIRSKGWPPAHLDADGDFPIAKEENDD